MLLGYMTAANDELTSLYDIGRIECVVREHNAVVVTFQSGHQTRFHGDNAKQVAMMNFLREQMDQKK